MEDKTMPVSAAGEPEWVSAKRRDALASFSSAPYPVMRYGLNITTDLGELGLENLKAQRQKPPKVENMNKDIIIADLFTALKEYPDIVEKHLFRSMGFADCRCPNCITNVIANHKLASFHQAAWSRGLLVYVPRGVTAGEPVYADLHTEGSSIDHTIIVAEPRSSLSFLENLSGEGKYRSGVVEVFAGDGSRVNFGSMQNYGRGLVNFSLKKAIIGRDANVEWVTCDIGSGITKSDVSSVLNGPGARTMNRGIFLGSEGQHFDFHINAIHSSPHTESYLLTKGALNDNAKAIYRGLVKIAREAKGANGYQKADTMILGGRAEADPVPYLEIDNNEVKCGHATTVGQIDPDKLFYLMSRGLTEIEAKRRILEGFFEPLVRLLQVEHTQNEARRLMHGGIIRGLGKEMEASV
ncbi:MAG: Fe-S cluster assembly protein SufD [Candidatus Aenigmarchaeota archaeon]|nr:Fe-S cluster assembly protein SufD [Candidatus Aenigmarchaeota archaeon]